MYKRQVVGGIARVVHDLSHRLIKDGHEVTVAVSYTHLKYRKPVPYNAEIIGKGMVIKENSKFFVVDSQILDLSLIHI